MTPSSISDLEINRNVRRVFVRYNINLGWVSITSCRGSVRITGVLSLLPGSHETLDAAFVATLFKMLRQTQGVSHITAGLTNWEHDGTLDGWKPKTSDVASKFGKHANDDTPFDLSKAP
ncbi:MAG: hypothetical protein WCR06_00320 [bacterium]